MEVPRNDAHSLFLALLGLDCFPEFSQSNGFLLAVQATAEVRFFGKEAPRHPVLLGHILSIPSTFVKAGNRIGRSPVQHDQSERLAGSHHHACILLCLLARAFQTSASSAEASSLILGVLLTIGTPPLE